MAPTTRTTKTSLLRPTDIFTALEILGIEIQKEQGDEIYALCPVHEQRVGKPDTKPSWSVNRTSGLSHCFSCGYSNNFVGLVMDVAGLTPTEAVRWVRKNGLTLDLAQQLPGSLDPPGRKKKPARIVPESVFAGMVDPPEKARESRQVSLEACREYGVLWDPDQHGWVLPVRWPDGVLMGWQFKKGPLVLNEPRRMKKRGALFGLHVLAAHHGKQRRMVVVESPLDCLRLWTEGISGAVSTFGAHVSDEQIRIITEYAGSVVLALDNDGAGQKETARLVKILRTRLPTYLFNYGDARGKDPGELERSELYRGLATARWGLDADA